MTYSAITRPVPKDQILGAIDKALGEAGLSNPEPHVSAHIAAALDPFPELALAVGDPGDLVQVSITGQANDDDHGEVEVLSISVRSVPVAEAENDAVDAGPVEIPADPTTGLVGAPGDQTTRVVTLPHTGPAEPGDAFGFATAE